MVSGLARSAEANSIAMHLRYDCFQRSYFHVPSQSHTYINGASADPDNPLRGMSRLAYMLTQAMEDAHANCPIDSNTLGDIQLVICLPESAKPYVDPDIVNNFNSVFEIITDDYFYQEKIIYVELGEQGFAEVLSIAHTLLDAKEVSAVMIAGVDSLLTASCISYYGGDSYGKNCRIITKDNADGFIPGEAAAAVLLTEAEKADTTGLFCTGIGFGLEPAPYGSGKVTRAEGMVNAINKALGEAGYNMHATDYRIANINGERYFFEEDALALQRTLRPPKQEHALWHPADSIGNIGAAFGPVMTAHVFWAARKSYAPGHRCLCMLSGDDERRSAFLLEYQPESK